MSESVPPAPRRRSPARRALNLAWVILGGLLVVEVAALVYTRTREASRHNANINRIKSTPWGPTGKVWYDLDGDRVKLVVFHRPAAAPAGSTINEPTVDLDYPFSAGKVWLNLSRTERVQVYDGKPQVVFHVDGTVATLPAPSRLTEDEITAFTRAAISASGADGFKQWLANPGLTSRPE